MNRVRGASEFGRGVWRATLDGVRSIVPARARGLPPRRFQAFGLGVPRSGTTSLAEIFSGSHTSRREAEHSRLNRILADHRAGRISTPRTKRLLASRDNRLYLELDVAHQLSELSGLLCEIHPGARFVLMIRDCYTWVESMFSKTIRARIRYRGQLGPWLDTLLEPRDFEYTTHDEPLRSCGCLPLDAYLRYFARANGNVLRNVPSERLFVLKTGEIRDRAPELARFVGTTPTALDPSRAHVNARTVFHGVAQRVDPAYLQDRCHHFCSDLMSRFYPGLTLSDELFPRESSEQERALYQLSVELKSHERDLSD